MRWLIVTDDWPPTLGGVATWSARVADELAGRGHSVRVLARHRPQLYAPRGLRVTGVRGPSFGRMGGRWVGLRGARAVLQADRVVATTWGVASPLWRLCDCPLHVVAHGSDVTRAPRSPRAQHAVWREATGRWAMSAFLARQLAQRGVQAQVLPAAVRLAPWPAPAGDGTRWAFVGRATSLKGGDRFVRWVAAAGVQGVVIGEGPELDRWRALAAQLGAKVRFVGAVPRADVRRWLVSVDLVALCARAAPDGSGAEGLGLTALEAAALGVPAVGVLTGGVPEAVGPGLLVPNPDDAKDVAERVAAWWAPTRGRDAWAWCRARHGVARTVDRLEAHPDR